MASKHYRFSDLISMEGCTGCRLCAEVCPAASAAGDGRLSALYRLDHLKKINKKRWGLFRKLSGNQDLLIPENLKRYGQTVFSCTLCGSCEHTCPVGIRLREIWISLRQDMAESGSAPEQIFKIYENLMENHNVFNEDNAERADWVEDMDDPPENGFIKDSAEVVYFTGCVSSYFPLAQKIPIDISRILIALKVDFTLLGEDEWCCGFPLLGAGLKDETAEIIDHNMQAVLSKKARTVVFACPSCHQMWRNHYPEIPGVEMLHVTQYLHRLFQNTKGILNEKKLTVTYHDPCDLGSEAGIFDPPRDLIRSISGIRLVELPNNRENCTCCGGGGNLEMIDAALSARIAKQKMDEIIATGAEAVVTSCQQCVRNMTGYVRRNKIPIKVMDISALIGDALESE